MTDILTAADAVDKIITVWYQIKRRIEQQQIAEALASDLSEFGLDRRRVALQTDVQNAQKILRDLSAPHERKKDVEDQLQSVYGMLKNLPPAIDEVVKNARRGLLLKHVRASANKDLAEKVEAYHKAFR